MSSAAESWPRTVWSVADWITLTGLTVFAGLIRFIGLADPVGFIYDEHFYVALACRVQNLASGACSVPLEIVPHPPLGELLIAAGGRLFGNGVFGWRFFPALAGTLTVALAYVLARRLFRSRAAAGLAAFLLAIDFMHFVNSRAALLDIFVPFFATAAFLCIVLDRDSGGAGRPWFRRPWLISSGICAGAAIASKWSGFLALAGLITVLVWWGVSDRRRQGVANPLDKTIRDLWGPILVAFVVVPAVCNCLVYIGRIHGSVISLPWSDGSWLAAWGQEQVRMYRFHTTFALMTSFRSPAWSWPLLMRPQPYFFERTAGGDIRWIMAGGSPLVWWSGLLAIVYCGVRWIREKVPTRAAGFIVIGFLTSYALYVPLSLRRSVWISYFLPAIPFLCLALGAVLDDLTRFRWSRTVAVVYAGAALALFAFFYPTLTATPLSPYQRELRIWFDDCGSPGWHIQFDPTGPIGPQKRILDSGAPPNGWCWGETRPI